MPAWLRPAQPATDGAELARAAIGGLLGVALAGWISALLLHAPGATPLLIAPIGASAVLLFAVPASPLAQPSALLGGNILAAAIGVTAAHWIAWPLLAAAVAVGGAIAAMALCRCLHPPSGAVALLAVIGGPHVLAAGYGFVLVPVLLNSVLLALAAVAYNRLTGRSYPHHAHPPASPPAPVPSVRPTRAECEAAIAGYGETLAIDADDLARLCEALDRIRAAAGAAPATGASR